MKREYEAPMMHCEEFVPNHFCSGCGTTAVATMNFECFNGPDLDGLENVLADVAGSSCIIKATYISSTTISKPGFTKGTVQSMENDYGFFAICYNDDENYHTTEGWDDTGVHLNPTKHPRQHPKWHCMASPAKTKEIVSNLS